MSRANAAEPATYGSKNPENSYDTMKPGICAYIIAYNQESKIADCVNSVLWADEVILIDSHSTDRTAAIASELGARVEQVPFSGFGQLRNDALKHCHHQWIFSLDSDERCTPEARDAILEITDADDPAHDYFFVPRRNFFMGRWIRHSGWYPNYRQPQLFRNGAMHYSPEPVHEGYVPKTDKPAGHLKAAIWQMPFENLEEVIHKMNRYSSIGVEKLEAKRTPHAFSRALTHGLWSFIKHYIFKRGFLDGWPGFIIALGNFEGTFYRHAKYHARQQDWMPPMVQPLRRNIPENNGNDA